MPCTHSSCSAYGLSMPHKIDFHADIMKRHKASRCAHVTERKLCHAYSTKLVWDVALACWTASASPFNPIWHTPHRRVKLAVSARSSDRAVNCRRGGGGKPLRHGCRVLGACPFPAHPAPLLTCKLPRCVRLGHQQRRPRHHLLCPRTVGGQHRHVGPFRRACERHGGGRCRHQ